MLALSEAEETVAEVVADKRHIQSDDVCGKFD